MSRRGLGLRAISLGQIVDATIQFDIARLAEQRQRIGVVVLDQGRDNVHALCVQQHLGRAL